MFCFNEFAFTVQAQHKINSTQILGFILICLYFAIAKTVAYFPLNSWVIFSGCLVFYGDYH